MQAQAGEIVDSWIEYDEKEIEKILSQNRRKDLYWIILFQQIHPGRHVKAYGGASPIVRVIKAYDTKPRPLVGAYIGEVDNKRGKITWRCYPKDIPVDWERITDEEMKMKQLIHECDIPSSYIYNAN